jgi:hypothetical protein
LTILRLLPAFAAVYLGVGAISAQTTQAILQGVVHSPPPEGAPLKGIQVTCRNATTGESVTAPLTDDSGAFAFADLSPGEYVLEFRDSARPALYQPREIHGIRVGVAAHRTVDSQLTPFSSVLKEPEYRTLQGNGVAATEVEYGLDISRDRSVVVETLPSTESLLGATRSDLILPALFDALPLSGRDIFTMLLTEPGVAVNSATVRSLGLEAGGQRPYSSNFLLDGIEFNNYLVTGPLTFIPPEAVQEYRISTNNFSADFGYATGFLANVVTRYGGRNWRGAVYSNLENRVLDAKLAPHGPERDWRFGYQAGGPVARNLFLSSAFDSVRDRTLQNSIVENLPTSAFLDFLNTSFPSSTARQLLTEFRPPATAPSTDGEVSHYVVAPPISLTRWLSLNRIDYSFRQQQDRFTLRTAISALDRPDFIWSPYPDFVSGLRQPVGSIMMGLQDARGPRLTNELRFGWTVSNIHWDRAHPEIPTLSVSGGNPGFESPVLPGSPAPYGFRYRTTGSDLHDQIVKIKGRHVIAAGAGLLLRHIDTSLDFFGTGVFGFGNILNFAEDSPSQFIGSFDRTTAPVYQPPHFSHGFRSVDWFGFVNDSFHLARRWTATAGVRYESLGPPIDLSAGDAVVKLGPGGTLPAGLLATKIVSIAPNAQLYPADHSGWAIRTGLSFDVLGAGTLVFRAGYGIFYDRTFDNVWLPASLNNLAVSLPLPATMSGACQQYLALACRTALLSRAGPPSDALTPVAFDPNTRNPYAQNFFGAAQLRISSNWSAEVDGIGSLGTHLVTTDLLNRPFTLPTTLTNNAENGDTTRYNPHLPEIAYRGNEGSSHYFGLTAQLRYHSNPLYFQSTVTWSHSIDNQSDPLAGEFFNLAFTSNGVANQAQPAGFTRQYDSGGDRGNSDFDQRFNWVEFVIWHLPSGPWRAARRLTEGWRIAELGAFRTGFPFSVLVPGNIAPWLVNNRANLVGPPKLANPEPYGAGKLILSKQSFVPPDAGLAGDTARNQFYGPGLYNLDLSVSRRISLFGWGEHRALTLRLDSYNLLNHLNLGLPDNLRTSPTFGVSSYGRNLTSNGFPIIAPLTETTRRLELLLRLEF